MKQLPINEAIQADTLSQLAEQYQAEGINELSFVKIPFHEYSERQFTALLDFIQQLRPRAVSLTKNQLGSALCIERWQALCEGFAADTLQELTIDENELDQFSIDHWNVLVELTHKHPLHFLSLQDNDLYKLEQESFEILSTIIDKLDYPTHISRNNWHQNLSGWHQLTTSPTTNTLSASKATLLNQKSGKEPPVPINFSPHSPS